MSQVLFPERLDLDPGHQVTDELGQVFGAAPPAEWAGRSGLLFADPQQNMFCFHVVRTQTFREVAELNRTWKARRVGTVPWVILTHDGYEGARATAENYVKCATAAEAQQELAAAIPLVCSAPVLGVYYTYSVNAASPVYNRIPGLFRFVPESLSEEWPLGHATGLVLVKMEFEQVADYTLSVAANGDVTEHVMR